MNVETSSVSRRTQTLAHVIWYGGILYSTVITSKRRYYHLPVRVAARSKAWVCGRSPGGIAGSNPARDLEFCCECFVLSGTDLCDWLINRAEVSYRVWCVWV